MGAWNIFRIMGDLSHILSKCILIFAIHRNRSAEGVSMITQVLYGVVFITRYLDVFTESSAWNLFFKIFYIFSSIYIVVIMRWLFPRTREKEIAWKLGAAVLGGSLVLSPFVMMIFEKNWSLGWWLWDFSEILESVCVVPQLLLLRQTTVPTVINSGYILTLGSYRALYIPNWILRGIDPTDQAPTVSVIFGIIQTAFYIDFAWVYYTRQRVKLRAGGIVDADDLRRGWLLNKIFGKRFDSEPDDEESVPALGRNGSTTAGSRRSKWGARGISISADDGVHEHEAGRSTSDLNEGVDPDAKMKDPDELARALDDDDDDDEDAPLVSSSDGQVSGVNNGSEWRDN
ncbi:ER lumen protein retaining receptor [Pseudomassariella vexata]|uniref:ER lumen protein retaining receptor n=1 Tax=Pseudomassariella vexata TaxID=1141098 RepID=A0A1Y2D882_9PEZI|nr:ER lumen protein retaining receptor [Pseudomassariella vexata]ORY55472.1 ER lumen protein retaining receptor [Pseudomassariella vexata]